MRFSSPSASTGRLLYVSNAAGTGSCYLTCHGFDHAPAEYGGLDSTLESIPGALSRVPAAPEGSDRRRAPAPRPRKLPPDPQIP